MDQQQINYIKFLCYCLGNYTCLIDSGYSQTPPVQQNFYVDILIPPTVKADNYRVTKQEGDDVELSCLASGYPQQSLHWVRKVKHPIF